MNVVIIGCGLIGRKRAIALGPDDRLVACCDTNEDVARKFSNEFGCSHHTDYKAVLSKVDFDSVVIAVVNKYAKQIVIDCLKAGKHVLAEKPLGRDAKEAAEILSILSDGPEVSQSPIFQVPNPTSPKVSKSPILKTGFNHRFHPAVRRAKEMFDAGAIGKLLNIRARYGHGGRPGMEKEWRASKDLCGGGELLDQGVHVVDLSRWFSGEIRKVFGVVKTKFWEMDVEDNAFVYMESRNGVDIQFNVSWTNWKNVFSFEVFGTEGYLKVDGLGGSYGVETLEYGKRRNEGGRPDVEVTEFPNEDISWRDEWFEFRDAIGKKRIPNGSGLDGLKANQIIEAIYKSAAEGKVIELG